MAAKTKTARRAAEKARGEDFLRDIESLTIKLENGQEVEFDLDAELRIPSDAAALLRLARKLPARLAFWAYQSERALGEVRRWEHRVARIEAEYDLRYRKAIFDQTDITVTERSVRSHVDLDASVTEQRTKLSTVRKQYGMLRAVRDAVEQQCFVIRRLMATNTHDAT